jgi:hypothetical protein
MVGDAVSRHFVPVTVEPFAVACEPEISAAPYWIGGECFNPRCRRAFKPAREWQIYCCTACERAGTAEFRRWGHRMAPALLVHRLGKYETDDEAVRARTRAARRYVTQLQSAWLREREGRA